MSRWFSKYSERPPCIVKSTVKFRRRPHLGQLYAGESGGEGGRDIPYLLPGLVTILHPQHLLHVQAPRLGRGEEPGEPLPVVDTGVLNCMKETLRFLILSANIFSSIIFF